MGVSDVASYYEDVQNVLILVCVEVSVGVLKNNKLLLLNYSSLNPCLCGS